MKKLLLLMALAAAQTVAAKSLVITLADTHATRVYYKLGGEVNPRLVIEADGTFTLNGREYLFQGVKNFYISSTDFSGEKNTEDAIIAIDSDGRGQTTGEARVYSLDGRLLQTAPDGRFSLQSLPAGTYVIQRGTSTLKVVKP